MSQVVAAAEKAYGHATAPIRNISESWTAKWDGGFETDTYLAAGDDYVVTSSAGGVTSRYGSYDGKLWDQNENGVVTLPKGIHGDSSSEFGTGVWQPARSNDARLLGEVASPGPSFVVQATSARGHRNWLFFDKATGLLIHKVIFSDGQDAFDYSKFESINGLVIANHVHETEQDRSTVDLDVVARRYNESIAPAQLRIPETRALVEFPAGVHTVRLPSHTAGAAGRYMIVRVTINGRGLDFLLDSGSAGIVLDSTVAAELGLKAVGSTQRGRGIIVKSAIVPEMNVGQLSMHNVVVSTTEVEQYPEVTTKIVGLLGYDFIASAVLKIDYVNGTVDAFDSSTFTPPADATFTDAALDDYVPMIDCTVSGTKARNVMIDTGAPTLMIVYSKFADAHFVGSPDPKKDVFEQLYAPYEGGEIAVAEYRAGSLEFGGYALGDVLIYVTYRARTFESAQEDSDGLIGYGLLQYFDLYLDYAHSRLYTAPNAILRSAERSLSTPGPPSGK